MMENEKELRALISTFNRQKNNKSINLLFFILAFVYIYHNNFY